MIQLEGNHRAVYVRTGQHAADQARMSILGNVLKSSYYNIATEFHVIIIDIATEKLM